MFLSILQEDDLIDLHFGLGLSIRNAFRLHDANNAVFVYTRIRGFLFAAWMASKREN
jgi:hypothetical protein